MVSENCIIIYIHIYIYQDPIIELYHSLTDTVREQNVLLPSPLRSGNTEPRSPLKSGNTEFSFHSRPQTEACTDVRHSARSSEVGPWRESTSRVEQEQFQLIALGKKHG